MVIVIDDKVLCLVLTLTDTPCIHKCCEQGCEITLILKISHLVQIAVLSPCPKNYAGSGPGLEHYSLTTTANKM